MSHSLFENLYHPLKYKVNFCDKMVHDVHTSLLVCTRGDRCAFYHDENDRRKIASNGCKVNSNLDDAKSCKSGLSSQGYSAKTQEKTRYAPFSPFEEDVSEVDVYQRKHARSDYMMHPLPSLSQPVAVGVSHHGNHFGVDSQPVNNRQDNVVHNHPYMMNQERVMTYNVPPSKRRTMQNSGEESEHSSSNLNGQIFNNQLFEGNVIPSRQYSNSENSAYMFNRQYPRGGFGHTPQVINNGHQNYNKQYNNASQNFDSFGVDSTTLSSEVIVKGNSGKIENDALGYLLNDNIGYGRRADSLKSPIPPGLSAAKYKMGEFEKTSPKSQSDFAEALHEKLDSKFNLSMNRKITEDKDNEDLSQNTSDNEVERPRQESSLKSKMCKNSMGFLPKHLREAKKPKVSDDIIDQIMFDIDKIIDSTKNSRKNSALSEDEDKAEIDPSTTLEETPGILNNTDKLDN
jgi:hypothetical protein